MHVKSRRRNPVLADIFSRLRYMERRGSGFKKICDNYSIQPHYREELRPTFYSDQSDFVLTLPNLNYDRKNGELLGSSKFAKLPQSSPINSPISSPKATRRYIPDSARQLLEQLRITPAATLADLGTALGVSPRMIKKYLQVLKEQGMIVRSGSNRKGYWQINEIPQK